MLEGSTADRIMDECRLLLMARGYHGFSYADIAETVGIRKPSIHHHFPGKSDLVRAVVARARAQIQGEAARFAAAAQPDAVAELKAYTGFWERCITHGSEPFCIAAILGAELPSLPDDVAAEVQGHFRDLTTWLTAALEQGQRQGTVVLEAAPALEAEALLSAVYGAMLSARAFADPARFAAISGTLLGRLLP